MDVKRAPHSLGKSRVGTPGITRHCYACLRSIAGLLLTLQGMLGVQLRLPLFYFCLLNESLFSEKGQCSRFFCTSVVRASIMERFAVL